MIEREVIEFVAAADWTDDCRVRVEMRKRRMTLTVTEAETLRGELDEAIREASRAAEGLVHVPVPLISDVGHVSPDCLAEMKVIEGAAGRALRRAQQETHPDQGGDAATFQRVSLGEAKLRETDLL